MKSESVSAPVSISKLIQQETQSVSKLEGRCFTFKLFSFRVLYTLGFGLFHYRKKRSMIKNVLLLLLEKAF